MTSSNGSISALLTLCAWNSHGALIFSLICAWTNDWVNNRDAGDLRRHHAHYDVSVMYNRWKKYGGRLAEKMWHVDREVYCVGCETMPVALLVRASQDQTITAQTTKGRHSEANGTPERYYRDLQQTPPLSREPLKTTRNDKQKYKTLRAYFAKTDPDLFLTHNLCTHGITTMWISGSEVWGLNDLFFL